MKLLAGIALVVCFVGPSLPLAVAAPTYLLKADLPPGTDSEVTIKLEIGGELLLPSEKEEVKKLPIKVVGNQAYRERMVSWSPDSSSIVRAIRDYQSVTAKIEVADQTTNRTLPNDKNLMLAEVRDATSIVTGAFGNLTREQVDLVNEVGNTLAIDRLLPGREVAEGESWSHGNDVIGALLGMDHVAVCEVSSVVAEQVDGQVQIRLAGSVHGTIDGTVTEMELRAAYLFHLEMRRIVRFNLAIKENRKPSNVVPGLDVVAKAFVSINPSEQTFNVPPAVEQLAGRTSVPLSRTLVYESPKRNFRFEYDDAWYVTAEDRNRISFRYLHDHEVGATCILTILPARSSGRHTPLEQFEKDVRALLGDQLEAVSASTEWETKRGHYCLGVIAEGQVSDIPMQWRHYLVAADDCPRLSFAVSLERNRIERFADAERQIIDSIELLPAPVPATASKPEAVSR